MVFCFSLRIAQKIGRVGGKVLFNSIKMDTRIIYDCHKIRIILKDKIYIIKCENIIGVCIIKKTIECIVYIKHFEGNHITIPNITDEELQTLCNG